MSGMAVGGFHAHADLLVEGRLHPAAQWLAASQPALAVWPSKSNKSDGPGTTSKRRHVQHGGGEVGLFYVI